MRTIYLPALILLIAVTTARANEDVLVDHVPGGADPAIVIAVVRQSLINRQWTIEAVGDRSVDAAIRHSDYDAKLRIVLAKGRLLYEGSAIKTMRTGRGPAGQQATRRKGNVPKRWIEYLRRDITSILATMPETTQ